MPFDLQVAVFGEEIVRRRFNRFAARARDMSPAFHDVARILRDATAENFKTRGVSGGSRWRDLTEGRIAEKRRLGLDLRTLRATGRLYGSLIGPDGSGRARHDLSGAFIPGGRDHVEEITPDSLRWGSRVPYGRFHQSSAPRTVIPYRPPVRLSERRKREIAKAMQRALVEGTR